MKTLGWFTDRIDWLSQVPKRFKSFSIATSICKRLFDCRTIATSMAQCIANTSWEENVSEPAYNMYGSRTREQNGNRRWTNVVLLLVQRRRRWTNIETTLVKRIVFISKSIYIQVNTGPASATMDQRWHAFVYLIVAYAGSIGGDRSSLSRRGDLPISIADCLTSADHTNQWALPASDDPPMAARGD